MSKYGSGAYGRIGIYPPAYSSTPNLYTLKYEVPYSFHSEVKDITFTIYQNTGMYGELHLTINLVRGTQEVLTYPISLEIVLNNSLKEIIYKIQLTICEPLENMPLFINDDLPILAIIANWRLKHE